MMQEKKRAAAALVNGIAGNGNGRAAAASAADGQGLSSTKAAGPTFQVWSRDSHGFCTECEDTRATVLCVECDEAYCSLCWAALHRRGERATHETIPLGSEEELAPPPEALEESGWLAGVWPSQRPRTSPHPAIPASSSSSAGARAEGGGVSSENGGGDSAGGGAVVVDTKNGKGAIVSNGAGQANGKSVEGWEGASVNRNIAAVPGAVLGAPAAATSAQSMTGNGEAAAMKGGAAVVPGGQPKKAKLNGSALAAAAPLAAAAGAAGAAAAAAPPQTPTIVPLTPPSTSTGVAIEVGAVPTPESSAHRSGSGSGSSSGSGAACRPEGHEGPLCPSGSFFSKPQTPPGSPTGGVSNGKNGATSTGERETNAQGGVGMDAKAEVDVAGGGRGPGRHSQEGDRSAAGGTGGGGSENGSTPAAGRAGCGSSNGDAGARAEESTKNGHGQSRNNGLPSSAAGKAGGEEAEAVVPAQALAAGATAGSDDMDVEAPLFSPAAMEAAAAGGGTDVEVPQASAPASEKSVGANGGGVPAGGDEAVGPAREATKSEKESLADLHRRSTNIPLRLDPREREILGVLEGSLHHVQYTDEVDRIVRGSRLPYVLKNLGQFFTSVWGMYKASGVSLPTYSPPSGAAKRLPPRHLLPSNKPPYQNGGSSRGGPAPVFSGKARAAGGGRNGSSGSGAYAWSAAGAGGGKAPAATAGGDGATAYREDSFVHKRTGWGYKLDWACALRTCFEVGRRHKILNPEKMRSAHGMLMCILMDTEHPLVREQTGFSSVRSMRTAFGLSVSTNLMGLFEDPDLLAASRPVLPWERGQKLQKGGRNVEEMALQAKEKAEARRRLVARHGTGGLACEVKLLVDSVADSIVYREISTRPIRRMLSLLKNNWRPDRLDDVRRNANLGIRSGDFGARLTHSHQTQFYFVLQSLMLWLEVTDNMLDLWAAGERDMLEEDNQYRLSNTGQGLQRVQGARRVGKRMNEYQVRVSKTCGKPWVGSAVVHLGDNCVPNALTFLDKYSQVPWILNPILQALDYLTDLDEGSDPVVLEYIKGRWGTVEYAQRYILRNFFRFGFDGSGGDNNYDAGSCVDGRLTSAWNWCSKIEKKSFLNVFKLSGFSGFDGDFSR